MELNADGSVQEARGPVDLMNHNGLYIMDELPAAISNLHITMIVNHLNDGTRPGEK